jgi:hypothetical protein
MTLITLRQELGEERRGALAGLSGNETFAWLIRRG